MTTANFGFQFAYRLTPDRGPADDVVSQLRIDGLVSSQTVLLPYSVGLHYDRRADRVGRRCDRKQGLSRREAWALSVAMGVAAPGDCCSKRRNT